MLIGVTRFCAVVVLIAIQTLSAQTVPKITGVLNGASFAPGAGPGTWMTIIGSNLSSSTRSWADADFAGNKLPTVLDGVRVTVNGKAAFVAYISPTQINFLSPDDSQSGDIDVKTSSATVESAVFRVGKTVVFPGLFAFSQSAGRAVIAHTPSGQFRACSGTVDGLTTQPAAPGEILTIYGTGFGPATPALPADILVTAPAPLARAVSVTVAGVAAELLFAGQIGSGLDQFNIRLPNLPGGAHEIVLSTPGGASQSSLYLPVDGDGNGGVCDAGTPTQVDPATLQLITRLCPLIYPPVARTARIQGTVRLSTVINRAGQVCQTQLVSGPALLVDEAKRVLKFARYTPHSAGQVQANVDIIFTLQ